MNATSEPLRTTRVTDLDRLLAAVSERRLTTIVEVLASGRFARRRVGSAGGTAARAWLARRLAGLGAQVSVDEFEVSGVPEVYAEPDVRWHNGHESARLAYGSEVAIHLASADVSPVRTGQLIVAGTGDPAGHWLIVPEGMTLFAAYADAHKAAGLVLRQGVDADGWQNPLRPAPDPGPLPILTLDPATHAALLQAATDGRAWLAANAPIRHVDLPAANVLGRWPSACGATEVLLTAHYDGVDDHPGPAQRVTADNASGIAIVLEAAQILAAVRPERVNLSVALLDAKEAGMRGSARHVARLRGWGANHLVINVDGVGHRGRPPVVEAGERAHGLLAMLDQASRHTAVSLTAGPVASDNRRYTAAGLSAIGIGSQPVTCHGSAHAPAHADAVSMATIVRLLVATVWFIGTSTVQPSLMNGDR